MSVYMTRSGCEYYKLIMYCLSKTYLLIPSNFTALNLINYCHMIQAKKRLIQHQIQNISNKSPFSPILFCQKSAHYFISFSMYLIFFLFLLQSFFHTQFLLTLLISWLSYSSVTLFSLQCINAFAILNKNQSTRFNYILNEISFA